MKPIKYPLETFIWRLHDEQGNARVEVRDADRNSVFYISIKGRAFQDSERLKNEIAPLIVETLNLVAQIGTDGLRDCIAKVSAMRIGAIRAEIDHQLEVLPEPTAELVAADAPRGRGRPRKT